MAQYVQHTAYMDKEHKSLVLITASILQKTYHHTQALSLQCGSESLYYPSSIHQDETGHSHQFLNFWGKETRPKGGCGFQQILCC